MLKYMLGTVSQSYHLQTERLSVLIQSSVTTGKVMNMAELAEVHGRAWEDVDVSLVQRPFSLLDCYVC